MPKKILVTNAPSGSVMMTIPLDILVNLAAAEGYLEAGKKIEAEFYMMQAMSRTYGVDLSAEESLSLAKRVKNISSRLGGGK